MFRDWHRDGIFQTDAGSVTKKGRKWTWSTPGGSREFFVDLISKDSLRVWPLVAGKPDSGHFTYTRTSKPHQYDLDLRPFFGHLRTDSILGPAGWQLNHFGRFYDLELGNDHEVLTQTNMPSMPRFQSWSLDSGRLILNETDGNRVKFKLDSTLPKILKLVPDTGKLFPNPVQLFQTNVNASRFLDFPLERFDQASFAHVIFGSDTLRYYFSANFLKGTPEDYEIQNQEAGDSSWLTLRINPNQESFQSSQSGFRYLMEGRAQNLGKFTCQALPTNDLVIRLTPSSDPTSARGQIQGHCHILFSAIAPVDSNILLEGIFRFKRKTITAHQSKLWLR